MMPSNDAGYTAVEFDLPDAQAVAIEEAAEEHGVPEKVVATALIKRSFSEVTAQAEQSDRSFVEVLAADLGHFDG